MGMWWGGLSDGQHYKSLRTRYMLPKSRRSSESRSEYIDVVMHSYSMSVQLHRGQYVYFTLDAPLLRSSSPLAARGPTQTLIPYFYIGRVLAPTRANLKFGIANIVCANLEFDIADIGRANLKFCIANLIRVDVELFTVRVDLKSYILNIIRANSKSCIANNVRADLVFCIERYSPPELSTRREKTRIET